LCYTLYQYGVRVAKGEIEDPTFFMAWWEPASPDADHRDPNTWREANPGLGDLLSAEDLASAVLRTPENEFRTKRCNQWVSTTQAWFPTGLWESLVDPRPVPDKAEVVLAFDGSFSGDSTGLTVHAITDHHIDVAACWEKPIDEEGWRVNPDEVEVAVRAAFERWRVRYCVYDPRIWQQMFERLAAEGYPVEAMPQGLAMIQAAQRFYDAAQDHAITHSGDLRLARHIGNAIIKASPQGWRVMKETPNSPRKIDLAICAVMGHAYAAAIPEPEQPFFAMWR
jgi:phage terminase large subunit-like protein